MDSDEALQRSAVRPAPEATTRDNATWSLMTPALAAARKQRLERDNRLLELFESKVARSDRLRAFQTDNANANISDL